MNLSELADLLIAQPTMGTCVRVDGSDDAYSFLSVLNLRHHQVRPRSGVPPPTRPTDPLANGQWPPAASTARNGERQTKQCVQQIRAFVLAACKDPAKRAQLQAILDDPSKVSLVWATAGARQPSH